MDALSGLLSGPRAQSAFLLRSALSPPWSLRIQDEAPLTVVCVTRGWAWVVTGDEPPVRMGAGDVAVVRWTGAYTVADDPGTAPQAIIHPGQVCETPDGVSLAQSMELGVRTWGNSTDPQTVMLTGAYESIGAVGARLLDGLPPAFILRADEWSNPVVSLLAAEIDRDEPAQDVVLDRLLDLLTVSAVRTWLLQAAPDTTGWFRGHRDPLVGRALRLLHNDPARPWTLVSLAAEIGLSRAALARRFQTLVGDSPMSYLAHWRMALAADLLADDSATVSSVARAVGYSSPFTFSAAYKRAYGLSPQRHRHRAG